MKEKSFIKALLFSVLYILMFAEILTIANANISTNKNKVVKTDSNFIYVMKYKDFNKDSTIVKYKAPIYLDAKIIKVDTTYSNRSVTLQNIKTKKNFSIEITSRSSIHLRRLYFYPNMNKIYKLKYTFYPHEGYHVIN